ncbi:MAG: hypothetical protein OSB39_12205, partial [Opitutales bacterium]|nr:hypothetical protein [Opitutales bacterium]
MKGAVTVRMLALALLANICSRHALAEDLDLDGGLQFNRDVRPILADHCYACHGPDAHSRKAKLRLDKRDSALGTNKEGAAIVPGKP